MNLTLPYLLSSVEDMFNLSFVISQKLFLDHTRHKNLHLPHNLKSHPLNCSDVAICTLLDRKNKI